MPSAQDFLDAINHNTTVVSGRLDTVNTHLASIEGKLDALNASVQAVDADARQCSNCPSGDSSSLSPWDSTPTRPCSTTISRMIR